MQFEKFPIPTENVDYREVARMMKINIELLKQDITEHVNNEIERFFSEIRYKD